MNKNPKETLNNLKSLLFKKEIVNIINYKDDLDENTISLYTYIELMNKICNINQYYYLNKIERKLTKTFFGNYNITINYFDYEKKSLNIEFDSYDKSTWDGHWGAIEITKENGKLKVIGTELGDPYELIEAAYEEINELYDQALLFNNYGYQNMAGIRSTNSHFTVNFQSFTISMVLNYYFIKYDNYFETNFDELKSINSENIGEKIFKHTYININDCPSFIQDELKEIRQKQIKNAQRFNFIRKRKKNN